MIIDHLGFADIRGISHKWDTAMYVTHGIGTSNPGNDFRLFTSPEIVLINPGAIQDL
jgi:predicted MPP superfamily phosphohydrolase